MNNPIKRFFWLTTGRDFPLSTDPATRMLPWIVGAMVYVMALAFLGIWALSKTASWWSDDLTRTATIQVPNNPPAGQSQTTYDGKLQSMVKLTQLYPGVVQVKRLSDEKIRESLKPFLGSNTDDLPLPVLFDVELESGVVLDEQALKQELQRVVKGVKIDTHRTWQDRLLSIVSGLQAIAWGVVIAVFLTTLWVMIFATKAMMQSHIMIIRTLHIIGATDKYISLQFQLHALKIGIKGTFFGFVLALGTVWGMKHIPLFHLGENMGQMPPLTLSPEIIASMVGLAAFISYIIAYSAGKTVHLSLANIFKNK